jgi:hypothetical protein
MSGPGKHDTDEDVRLYALHSLQRAVSYQAGSKRCLSQISAEDRRAAVTFLQPDQKMRRNLFNFPFPGLSITAHARF